MDFNHENDFKPSSSLQTPPAESQKCNFVQDALSNSLILREIFTFLDAGDLGSCSHVCQDWRRAADPFDFSHYDIILERSYKYSTSTQPKYCIFVRGSDSSNRKIFTQRTNIVGVTELLEALLNQNVSISLSLRVSGYVDIQDNKVMDFISKIGPLVLDLDMRGMRLNAVDVCKLLVQKFPNLKKLNCCGLRHGHQESVGWIEDPRFNPDLPENKHKELRTISFGRKDYSLSSIKTMLKISQNLDEIEDFPLEMINAIVVTQKGQALKSLCDITPSRFKFCENGETVVTAFEKLAGLEPKLTSLEFDIGRFPRYPSTFFASVKPYWFSVLQSSHESMESLLISPVKSDEIQHFPPLTGLKELKLVKGDPSDLEFFPPEMPLVEIFPNVSRMRLESTWDMTDIKRYFPKNIQISGQIINELSINDMAATCMVRVRRRFPFRPQHLRMTVPATNLHRRLLQVFRCWPKLKSLTIYLHSFGRENVNVSDHRGSFRLDSAFTGLPEQVIDQLEDPSKRKDFTQEQIQEFKNRSVIAKLKELKELKLILSCGYKPYIRYTYMRLSPVANEFGFNLLPALKVTVDIQNVQTFAKEIKTDLEPLGLCSNIEVVDDSSYTEYMLTE